MRYPDTRWQAIHQAYLNSGLTIVEFYRGQFASFFTQDENVPTITTVYRRFRRLAALWGCAAQVDALPPTENTTSPAVEVTPLGTNSRLVRFGRDAIRHVVAESSGLRKNPCRRQDQFVRMTLPSGVHVDFATSSSERLALEAILLLSREAA